VVRRCIMKLSLAMMVLILLLGATSFVQASPAQGAETVVPAYGADANPTGNPIGGGTGYSDIIDSSAAKYTVSTKSQLLSALSSATSGQIIYVADSAQIDLTGSNRIAVPAGVILASGRGRSSSSGGLIFTNDTTLTYQYPLFKLSDGVRVTGLRMRGPSGEVGTYSQEYLYSGLAVSSDADAEVDNCEIYNWPLAGVGVGDGAYGYFHHNYIHNCRRAGFGYGVAVCGGSALVEANLFNYNRHSVMAARGYPVSNYEARYNIFETGCNTAQSCDVHGGNDVYDASVPAGGTILIHHNTFKAIWNALNVRGIPSNQVSVYKNWALHDPDDWGPYEVFMQSLDNLGYTPYVRMTVYDNWYGTTPPPGVSLNNAPAKPSAPSGTASGVILTQYEYLAKTTDTDGDKISYTFYWADGNTSTTALLDSGATAAASHTWTQAGTYGVYVRATDSKGANSAWSSGMTVEIADSSNNAPAKPFAPSGTASGVILTQCQYQAATTDPDGDGVWYTFNWGDGTISTTNLLDSGATASASHTWTQAGTYGVYVRATDSEGNASGWSPGLTVNIVKPFQPSTTTNNAPTTPPTPSGPTSGETSTVYQYVALTTDPDADTLLYTFDWGDGSSSTTAQVDSGVVSSASHTWTQPGTYAIQVKATDSEGAVSASSSALSVSVLSPPPAAPATPATPAAAPAQETSAVVIPTVETPTESPTLGPPTAAVENAGGSLSPAVGGSSAGGPQRSGLVWWLFSVSVIVGGAVLLTGAIVRDTISEPPGW